MSNFNETEQIVVLAAQPSADGNANGTGGGGETRFAFVQTRGSVPVYWAEINNLRYKPDLKVLDLAATVSPSLPSSPSAPPFLRTSLR